MSSSDTLVEMSNREEIAATVLREKLDEIEARITNWKQMLENAESQRDSLMVTLMVIDPGRSNNGESSVHGVTASMVRNMDLRSAVEFIASSSDGFIDSTPVRIVLTEAGLLPPDIRLASQKLWEVMSRSDTYTKIGRGKYRYDRRQHIGSDEPTRPARLGMDDNTVVPVPPS